MTNGENGDDGRCICIMRRNIAMSQKRGSNNLLQTENHSKMRKNVYISVTRISIICNSSCDRETV